jgi:hypothetical protein
MAGLKVPAFEENGEPNIETRNIVYQQLVDNLWAI